MSSTKEIRRRIRSVKSTRQITRAMELVAAAKMRKAQAATLATRTYARLAWELVHNLTDKTDVRVHKFLRARGSGSVAIVLMTSNRGLIGGFNSHIVETAVSYAKKFPKADFISMGKKGRDAIRKAGFNIAADFEKKDSTGSVLDINPVANFLIQEFLADKYDKIVLIYMDFVSTLVQKPHVLELLPLRDQDLTLGATSFVDEESTAVYEHPDYIFEPSPDFILETVLPRLTVMQIYQALLETNAAEHSARMVAMKNASDAAADIISDLTLEYNQIRQASITKEISEIVSGKLALTN